LFVADQDRVEKEFLAGLKRCQEENEDDISSGNMCI
jgi:hypothetical protein